MWLTWSYGIDGHNFTQLKKTQNSKWQKIARSPAWVLGRPNINIKLIILFKIMKLGTIKRFYNGIMSILQI